MRCDIVSAEKDIFSGEAEMVAATGELGELGIFPGHAPLISALVPGTVTIKIDDNEEKVFYISGGYIEVQPSWVTILADVVMRAEDIDEKLATQTRRKAEKSLAEQQSKLDYTLAASRLAESAAQLRTLRRLRKRLP